MRNKEYNVYTIYNKHYYKITKNSSYDCVNCLIWFPFKVSLARNETTRVKNGKKTLIINYYFKLKLFKKKVWK